MAATKWFMEADYLQACNCDYGCPCEFEAPPTQGYCDGLGAWRITGGKFGEVSLDGLAMAFAAHWPAAIHKGGGTLALFFEEKATPQQRDALMQIASGQAGGMPFEIIVTTISHVLEPQYVPFKFQMNGRNSSVKAGALEIGLAPIKNPVTGSTEGVRILHETGFIFQSAEVVAGAVCNVALEGLKFSWPDKAGFLSTIRYAN